MFWPKSYDVALMLAVVVGETALTMLLEPVLHPVKTAATASNMHAPKRAQFLAISKFSLGFFDTFCFFLDFRMTAGSSTMNRLAQFNTNTFLK
jgi:hypothetical protein